MAVHTYRFASTILPGLGASGTGYTAAALGLVLYYDVAIDPATESLTDLTTLMAERGFTLFATDPAPTIAAASSLANADIVATSYAYGNAETFTSATRTFGTANNGADVVNPSTNGQLATKLGGTETNLLVRLAEAGRMSAAGTSTTSAKMRLGYTTSNTAGTAFTANSLDSGSVSGTGTTDSGHAWAIQWLITGLAAGNYYFYRQLIAVTSGTVTTATAGGFSLRIDEVPA
jgi:hypothetical protein